jgi:hypothetical protein
VSAASGFVATVRSSTDAAVGQRWTRNGTIVGEIGSADAIVTGGSGSNFGITTPSTNALIFGTNATERARIDSSGNLGIGCTPSSFANFTYLSINGTTGSVLNLRSNNTTQFEINTTGTLNNFSSVTTLPFVWSINSAERMRLDSSGNLGIGTSSPTFKLEVNGNAYFNNITMPSAGVTIGTGSLGSIAGAAIQMFGVTSGTYMNFNTNGSERARITSGGNFLINTTSSIASTLISKGTTSNNTASACHFMNSSDAALFFVRNDGYIETGTAATSPYNNTTGSAANMFVDSAGGLSRSTSSIRYKIDIKNATHGLAEVLALRPVTYKGINDKDKVFGGLIAEEVHDIGLTEFVAYNNANEPDALHYGNMVALLTKAIQEQQAIITQLTARVAQLESK